MRTICASSINSRPPEPQRHRDTETILSQTPSVLRLSHDHATDPLLHHGIIEIQDDAYSQLSHAKVGQHLRDVDLLQSLDALDLYDDLFATTRSGRCSEMSSPL